MTANANALALLLVLAAFAAPAATDTDEPGCFTCRNGRDCIDRKFTCDGNDHCRDASDEWMACPDTPTTTLGVGESVPVRATITAEQPVIAVLVCNASECGRLSIAGAPDDTNNLVFMYSSGCGWPLWGPENPCRHEGPKLKGPGRRGDPGQGKPLAVGDLSLVVERRPSQLAVWAADRPDNVGLVDAPPGGLTVRVRSHFNHHNFTAEFGGVERSAPVAEPAASCVSASVQSLREDLASLRAEVLTELSELRAEVRARPRRHG